MSTGNGSFEGFAEIFGIKGMRRAAASIVDAGEQFAKIALDLEAKAIEISKGTPFESLLAAHHSLAKSICHSWTEATRKLWRIDETPGA